MPRPLNEIIAHIRAVSANPAINTTLIQTEDLELLCDAASLDREKMIEAIMERHLNASLAGFPDGGPSLERSAELDSYRPYAEADVDAIIAALRPAADVKKAGGEG